MYQWQNTWRVRCGGVKPGASMPAPCKVTVRTSIQPNSKYLRKDNSFSVSDTKGTNKSGRGNPYTSACLSRLTIPRGLKSHHSEDTLSFPQQHPVDSREQELSLSCVALSGGERLGVMGGDRIVHRL